MPAEANNRSPANIISQIVVAPFSPGACAVKNLPLGLSLLVGLLLGGLPLAQGAEAVRPISS